VEIMVVATILPAVEADLHGLKLYGWIYAALTLASIGSVPIAGRMTDRLGGRPLPSSSLAFFLRGVGPPPPRPRRGAHDVHPGRRAVRTGYRRRRPVHRLARHRREDLSSGHPAARDGPARLDVDPTGAGRTPDRRADQRHCGVALGVRGS